MENKYYQPEIEEFYVGFECEWQCKIRNETWNKQVCDVDLINIAYDAIEHADKEEPFEEQFRVKYLDEKDILDLGFEQIETRPHLKSEFVNSKEFGRDEKIYFGDFYQGLRYIAIENNCGQFYFMGWIKNKSELKKVLKMVT